MYCSGRIWLVSLLEISWKTLCVSFISPLTLPCPRHQQREQLGQQTRQRHGGDQDQCRGATPLHTHQETSTHEHRDHRDDEQHVRGETETKHRPPRQILYVWTFYIGLSCGVAWLLTLLNHWIRFLTWICFSEHSQSWSYEESSQCDEWCCGWQWWREVSLQCWIKNTKLQEDSEHGQGWERCSQGKGRIIIEFFLSVHILNRCNISGFHSQTIFNTQDQPGQCEHRKQGIQDSEQDSQSSHVSRQHWSWSQW